MSVLTTVEEKKAESRPFYVDVFCRTQRVAIFNDVAVVDVAVVDVAVVDAAAVVVAATLRSY